MEDGGCMASSSKALVSVWIDGGQEAAWPAHKGGALAPSRRPAAKASTRQRGD